VIGAGSGVAEKTDASGMGQMSARQPGGKVPENLALPRQALVKKLTNLRELNSSFFSSKNPYYFQVWS
jgi:hypothetical protein